MLENLLGQRVYVHWNLHKKVFSITKNGGKVIAHVDQIFLKDCEFRVRKGGRERVLKEQRKNVHAFVIGTVCRAEEQELLDNKVIYNPYQSEYFQDLNFKKSVLKSDFAQLSKVPKGEKFGASIRI